MANRNFNRYQALEKEVKVLFCKFSVGAAGVVTFDATNSKGIESVTLLSTGRYEIKLEDRYNALLHIGTVREYTGSSAIGTNNLIRSEDVDGTRIIVYENIDASGTPQHFPDGTTIRLRLELKNSSVR